MRNSERTPRLIALVAMLAVWGGFPENAEAAYTPAYSPEDPYQNQRNRFVPAQRRRGPPSVHAPDDPGKRPSVKTLPSGVTAQPLGMNRPPLETGAPAKTAGGP